LGQHTSAANECWKQEFGCRLSMLRSTPAEHAWPEHDSGDDTLTAKAQVWMHTPFWTFCTHCGRRELQSEVHWHWRKNPKACVQRSCPGGCDLEPAALQHHLQEPRKSHRLKAYVTPQHPQWQGWIAQIAPGSSPEMALHAVLGNKEMLALAPVELRVDWETRRGGQATVTSRQKQSLIRARWKATAVEDALESEPVKRAFEWLMTNNTTYASFVNKHKDMLREGLIAPGAQWIPTAQLLLQLPGLEVAARPWLYPHPACGDTDLADRLKALNQIVASSTPSLKTGWLRKVCSRCLDYVEDYELQCFLYDVSLARTVSAVPW
jgi:hypothetical protein